jgi:hypothetical protein
MQPASAAVDQDPQAQLLPGALGVGQGSGIIQAKLIRTVAKDCFAQQPPKL